MWKSQVNNSWLASRIMSPVNLKFRGFTTLSKSYRKETDRQTDGCNTLSFLLYTAGIENTPYTFVYSFDKLIDLVCKLAVHRFTYLFKTAHV